MITKREVIDQARKLGFDDVGFTTADAFEAQQKVLSDRQENYSWLKEKGMDLIQGTDPKSTFPEAKSIIVLVKSYFRHSIPASLVGKFGRCYVDDDRVTRGSQYRRTKEFCDFLSENGIETKIPSNLPHRLAAARAGLGTFGRNCLIYSNKVARKSSWIIVLGVVVNCEFEPDTPTLIEDCPRWCKNTCLVACPTNALIGPRNIDPRKCISFLSYYGNGITPLKLREPMGMWVYGCDRCQNVCPRNEAWLAQDLPINPVIEERAEDFELTKLLHMDVAYFKKRIWPHMFYMPTDDIWRWKMNVARVMGNSHDSFYIPHLERAFSENNDERVKGMAAWALGCIGGFKALEVLNKILKESAGMPREEIIQALER
ncbi:4Fe-4S double cluster binding domain-containing protein [Desulfosporosinus burensis]